jgi:hypothetical protein
MAQIVLQVLARIEAARVAQRAQEDALKAQEGATKAQDAAIDAAREARGVKTVLSHQDAITRSLISENTDLTNEASKKLDRAVEVLNITHELVNSAMGAQLKLNATVSRRLANLTGEAADVEAANEAERLLGVYEVKQAKADAKRP